MIVKIIDADGNIYHVNVLNFFTYFNPYVKNKSFVLFFVGVVYLDVLFRAIVYLFNLWLYIGSHCCPLI
jgi:hypothetical protein